MITDDRTGLAPIHEEARDVVGEARGRDAAEGGVVGHRGLGRPRGVVARFAEGAVDLSAHDRRGGRVALERRGHVKGADVVAVDRDPGTLRGCAALRGREGGGERRGARGPIHDQPPGYGTGTERGLTSSGYATPPALGAGPDTPT